jgi:outer membrane protein assembly factor BamB
MIIAATNEELVVLDETEGKPLWRARPGKPPTTGPVIRKTSVVFGTATGISAHGIIDGKLRWHAPVGPVNAAIASCGDLLAAITSSGTLVILDADTGEIRATQEGAIPDMPPLPARDSLLYAMADGWNRYDIPGRKAERWMQGATSGAMKTPMILSNSSVYFATEKLGLIRAGKLEQ